MSDGRVIDALLYLMPLSGIESRFLVTPDHSLDTTPTAIWWLISKSVVRNNKQ